MSLLMKTNWDKQYKTEAFVMLKKPGIPRFFLRRKLRNMKKNYFLMYV
jgi:hypothetical protein